MAGNREFFHRRLHSLLGVIPVGLFLIMHLMLNYNATKGPEAFNKAAGFMENLPFLLFLEFAFIYIPIVFHAIYGVYIAFTAKPNVGRFGKFRNWMFVLQRFTGIFLIIFIAWHVWETRLAKAFFGTEVNFDMMANIVDNPLMLIFYIIGIVSATFHLANGLWSFCVSWGITVSPRSQQINTYVTMAIFLALSYVGIRAILAFT
ncbi:MULTISPECIES: succinate dehydrogenase cytochrome b558 subunit [Bacillaceae]|jgi:succinate dehydrogenase / fumarate reductase cytochrome b subunit|uniref:Succinate dehydrogenase cytochrome b558 subunit n=2 Tax=Bacillaceae TaxID=186817 RepID=A0A090KU46_9BACI|nr:MULTISPECIES: succinate dehydrogenase cytochrome b558 subunit [Bacillaceae]MBU5342635.1 succinate dehydrogenase cytochrome b558 subunit [Caldifermentibacillus hisashii]MCM3477288.1 succinate dehydrogenase cytochrome b558 subunit [Caldibacillus thermoamylovorans]MEC5270792.1 succinate dehydrogenase cytochrome b558 subunit [Caldifermentibacillus hisashii]MED4851232.1 succinate dehydrogenase cytochrome b558 subunit [Caldifermentibacillus hisashii]PAC36947.1 succinate dehydrogenase [Caldifermen